MENRINRLKENLSQYDTRDILGAIATHFITFGNNGDDIARGSDPFTKTSLLSPQKQYAYLAGLLMCTNDSSDERKHLEDDYFQRLENQIQDITTDYIKGFMDFDPSDVLENPEKVKKNFVSAEAFISYFDTGTLRYEEQTINLINTLYSKFNVELCKLTHLEISDFISYYNFIKKKYEASLTQAKEIMEKSMDSYFQNASTAEDDVLQAYSAIDSLLTVSIADINSEFGEQKAKLLIDAFAIERKDREFLYYNSDNPFISHPLAKIDNYRLFVIHPIFLLDAIYNKINLAIEAPQNSFAEKFKKWKAECVEHLFLEYLKTLLGSNAKFHTNVCEQRGTNEHDILVELDDYIIIAEVKASKVRVPLFNPEKAYKRVYDHFNSDVGIGGAYKQAIILKNFLKGKDTQTLYENKIDRFEISNISKKKILPFVLTLNQFGSLAINTSTILQKEDNEPYPWVCNLSDIDNICTIFNYLYRTPADFLNYVQWRTDNHPHIFSSDELDILEAYIFSKDIVKRAEYQDIIFMPNGPQLVDKIYFENHNIPYTYSATSKFGLTKPGVNDLCPCGSGRKYKKCCRKKGLFD